MLRWVIGLGLIRGEPGRHGLDNLLLVLDLLTEHLVVREDRVHVASRLVILFLEKPGLVLLELQVALEGLPVA